MNSRIHALAAAVALMGLAAPAAAKVSAEEAAKLGKELTPIGAVKAANADGSIPEHTGEANFPEDMKTWTPEFLEQLRKSDVAKLETSSRSQRSSSSRCANTARMRSIKSSRFSEFRLFSACSSCSCSKSGFQRGER